MNLAIKTHLQGKKRKEGGTRKGWKETIVKEAGRLCEGLMAAEAVLADCTL